MSASDGMHPFSCSSKPILADAVPLSAVRSRNNVGSLNSPFMVSGGGGASVVGFPERSPVFLTRSLDLFADGAVTLAAAAEQEPHSIGAGNVCTAIPVQEALPEAHGTDVVPSNRPDWLPHGWLVEIHVRTGGATAGARDRYFFDPVSKRRFRSRKEVFSFLATGKLGRYKPKLRMSESEASSVRKNPSAGLSSKRKNFDYFSRPAKVRWVLDGDGSWAPFIGNEELSESTKRAWMAALDLHRNGSNLFDE